MKKIVFLPIILSCIFCSCTNIESLPTGGNLEVTLESSSFSSEPAKISTKIPAVTTNNTTAGTTKTEVTTVTIPKMTSETTPPPEIPKTEAPISTEKVTEEMPQNEDWMLILVNSKNPLPENYDITTTTVFESYMKFKMDNRMSDYTMQMLADAKSQGINLTICSAYRSVEKQKSLFKNDIDKYMGEGLTYDEAYAKTAKNVAVPGYSEHSTGLAADILSDEYSSLNEKFDTTKAYAWLDKNAYKYGFILRYPKDKVDITGINYEPWHYRFVGLESAKEIEDSGVCLEEFLS